MFRRRDGEDDFEGNEGTTSFGGFQAEQGARQRRDAEMNEEAVDTLSAQKSTNLFKTVAPESQTQSTLANVTPKSAPAAATSFANIGANNTTTTNTVAPSAPKPTTGSPSSRFEGVEAERRLTVGYGITLNGKISNCDKLIIYGTVDAELNDVKTLHISESGTFKGSASIDHAEISGTFEGDINVADNIIINSTGRVNGKITYGSIEIRPGGKFTGEIVEAGEEDEAPAAKKKTTKKTKKSQQVNEEFTLAPEPLESLENEEAIA